MRSIANLYDTLKKANDRNSSLYSIHKKLNYSDDNISNLYDYILDKYDLSQKISVLDCGCGVGFGTILMAKKLDADITGISVSPSEIESANNNLTIEKSINNISFECKSFDHLGHQKYDAIIAIESLKHSPLLSKSLDSIVKALKSGGELFVIEDISVESSNSLAKRKLKSDWILSKLYLEEEYTNSSKEMEWITVDMTSMMRKTSRLEVIAKIIGTEIKASVDKILKSRDSAASIFRGGFYQEWLYLNGTLRYKLLKGKKL